MVLASMYGSSASNGYGSGGTVNATGFSSSLRFDSNSNAVPERKAADAPLLAPSNPAPAMPELTRNFRRFMGVLLRRGGWPTRRLYHTPLIAERPSVRFCRARPLGSSSG